MLHEKFLLYSKHRKEEEWGAGMYLQAVRAPPEESRGVAAGRKAFRAFGRFLPSGNEENNGGKIAAESEKEI